MNLTSETMTWTEAATQSAMSVTLYAYIANMLEQSFIWFVFALILVVSDLYFGIEAAKARKETIKFSRALRRTISKICEYICWIMLSITLSMAFGEEWLMKAVFGIVYGNEICSCLTNYFEAHGKKIELNIFKIVGGWLGKEEISEIEITDLNECDDGKDQGNFEG